MVASSKEAVEQGEYLDLLTRMGFSNPWALWDNYLNELTNYATKKVLTKKSSNGQTWAQRLAAADVQTKYHVGCLVQAMRLEWGVLSRMESEAFIRK